MLKRVVWVWTIHWSWVENVKWTAQKRETADSLRIEATKGSAEQKAGIARKGPQVSLAFYLS